MKWHDPAATFAEGIASRGDRRIGRVIERVWRAGGTFQEWSEHFALDRWLDAMAAEGLDPDWYVTRHRTLDEVLPWDHVTAGLHKDFLWQDWQASLAAHGLPDCRWTPCYDCGVCTDYAHRARRGVARPPGRRESGHGPGAGRGNAGIRRSGAVPRHETHGSRGGSRLMRGTSGFPVRLMYTKRGKVRWISHRDVARAMERAFRIAELPLAFTEGFSPRPKVSFGLALSTGHESDGEYLDLEFVHEVDTDTLPGTLTDALPDGIEVIAATPLVDRAPALQEAVTAVEWNVGVVSGSGAAVAPADAAASVDRALAASELPTERQRKGRTLTEDVRPVIRRIEVRPHDGGTEIVMELSTQPRSAKPGDILAAIERHTGSPGVLAEANARRTHQWIERDGTRWEPQDADTRPRGAGSARVMREGIDVRVGPPRRVGDDDRDHRRIIRSNADGPGRLRGRRIRS